MSDKLSPPQAAEAMNVMDKLITGSLEVSKQQFMTGAKASAAEFEKLVSERTRQKFLHQGEKPKTEPGRAETKTTPAVAAPPAEAVEQLRKMKDDPKARQQFDDVFGAGAADAALGGK